MNDSDVAEAVKFKTLLLTTDGSDFSMGTERVGLDLAAQHGSHLQVLRMVLSDPGTPGATADEEEASMQMERIGALCAERGIQFTPLIRNYREPSQGILDVAKEIDANLVIVGRRGKRGLARLMVGDATAKVLDKSECSVLVVPRLVNMWQSSILLVADPDQNDDRAAMAAITLARTSSLPLTVLMITDDPEEPPSQEANQLTNRLVALAKLQEVAAEGLVHAGKIDEVILEAARQRSADLIVCSPRERSMFDKLFNNNNIVSLIGQAHCPVMVAKQ